MKLIYLWVQEFRCFHNQGFNFTNEYHAELNENEDGKYELTLKDKDGFISPLDFWMAENNKQHISGLRVFVGENGKGKTALLELAHQLLDISGEERIKSFSIKFFLLVEESENKFRYKENIKFNKKCIFGSTVDEKKFYSIYEQIPHEVFFNVSNGYSDIEKQVKFASENKPDDLKNYLGFYFPKKLQIIPNDTEFLIQDIENEIKGIKNNQVVYANTDKIQECGEIAKDIGDLSRVLESKINRISGIKKVYASLFLALWFVWVYFRIKEIDWKSYSKTDEKETEKIKTILEDAGSIKNQTKLWETLNDYIDITIKNNKSIRIWTLRDAYQSLKALINMVQSLLVEEDENLFLYICHEDNKAQNEQTINKFNRYVHDIKNVLNERQNLKEFIRFDWGLSSGEYAIMNTFAHIYSFQEKWKVDFANKEHISPIIFLDEIDLSLHPRWQQRYLKYLLRYLNKECLISKNEQEIKRDKQENKKDKQEIKIQLILCTHSPIILSDVPNEFVTYLRKSDKPEEAGFSVVDEDDDKRTFGANIYDIYNDVFFMDKTGMGVRGAWVTKWIKNIDTSIQEQEQKLNELRNADINEHELCDFSQKLNTIEKKLKILNDDVLVRFFMKRVNYMRGAIFFLCSNEVKSFIGLPENILDSVIESAQKAKAWKKGEDTQISND